MRKTCDVEQREQNGQFGGASHENRTYKKAVNVFSEVQMESAIDAIVNQKSVPEFSKVHLFKWLLKMITALYHQGILSFKKRICS